MSGSACIRLISSGPFRLFSDLGMSEEDIAARHFVTSAIVKQRLRLASVSPKLHEVYAEDGMTLEQLMAFSVTADHARQEQVWENVSRSGYDEPYQIRRMLTENTVRASDRRALYVGIDAYEQAGGSVLRDLFEHDDGGWLQDVALLDRLVTEKLTAEAETIAKEGWKWISVAVDFPYGHASGLRELEGKPADLTIEEQATIDALNAEQAKLEFDYQDADELPDEVDQRLGEIEAALMAFEERSVVYDPADILRAGVFVSIDSEGRLSVDRGYVRPEDEAPADDPEIRQGVDASSTEGQEAGASVQRTAISVAGHPAETEEDDEDAAKPLPDRLITELTAHRTLALRNALAENPAITFQAVLHNFVLTAFYRFASSGSCLEIGLRTPAFPAQAPGLRESVSAKAVEARHEGWKERLPKSEADLWEALTALDGTAQASLFAHCASFAVNAVYEPANRTNQGRVSAHGVRTRLDQADVLARAVGLDMVQAGWKPTVDNYLGRVTKPRILEAVREANGDAVGATDRPSEEGAIWPRRPSAFSMVPAGCRSRCVSSTSRRRRQSRMAKLDRCPNFSLMTRTRKASATTIGHSSMPPNDVPSQDGSGRLVTVGGPVLSAGPHFYWRWLRARGGPARV